MRLMSEIIAARSTSKQSRNAKNIIIPIYGQCFDESLDSKYPRWLKLMQVKFQYWKRQFSLNTQLRIGLKNYISQEQLKSIHFSPPALFLLSSVIDHCKAIALNSSKSGQEDRELLDGLRLQDQVIDTYLRFKPSEKYNPKDQFIKNIWHRARSLQLLVKAYTSKNSHSKVCISGYSSYINEGIFTRQAVISGCKLVTLGSSHSYYKIHDSFNEEVPSHLQNHSLYSINKADELPQHIIEAANQALMNRTKGNYDNSMPYMKNLRETDEEKDVNSLDCKNKVIMLLHDFFDAPHSYKWIIFEDFWAWATETIEFCSRNRIPLVIKPHPNQSPASIEVTKKLKAQYREYDFIEWIAPTIGNSAIFAQKPKLILTVFGSVAPEAAYCKLKVLLAGDHPAINFAIGYTAKSKKDYWNQLLNIDNIDQGSRKASIYFTALHNKNIFLKNYDSLWTHESIDDKSMDSNQFVSDSANRYVRKMTQALLNELNSNTPA